MTEKRYLIKHCLNCANMVRVNLGWGKQELQDCKGRPASHTHGCDVFMPSKQIRDLLRYDPSYELMELKK